MYLAVVRFGFFRIMAENAHQVGRGEASGDDACRLGMTWEICANGFTCAARFKMWTQNLYHQVHTILRETLRSKFSHGIPGITTYVGRSRALCIYFVQVYIERRRVQHRVQHKKVKQDRSNVRSMRIVRSTYLERSCDDQRTENRLNL